jgi:preprotein translocase subunit Sec61beta
MNKRAQKGNIRLPASSGGLMRYFEDVKSKITIRPDQVIVLTLIVIVFVVLLHLFGKQWLGF